MCVASESNDHGVGDRPIARRPCCMPDEVCRTEVTFQLLPGPRQQSAMQGPRASGETKREMLRSYINPQCQITLHKPHHADPWSVVKTALTTKAAFDYTVLAAMCIEGG